MQKYINQLLQEIEEVIRARWHKYPPHFHQTGIPDPYLIKPESLNNKTVEEVSIVESIKEVELFKHGDAPKNMFSHFGFSFEQFPPISILNQNQVNALTEAILKMWSTFNYVPTYPENTPSEILYPLLCNQMEKPHMLFNNGVVGIEFCEYNQKTCPFGDYCHHDDIIKPNYKNV